MADESPIRQRARRRGRRRLIVLGLAAVIVAGGVGAAWAVRGSSGPQYRLGSAATGTVTQTLHADGVLAASQTASRAFVSAGTVAAVGVAVGDTVRAGQTLATLDPASLREAVTDAQNTVAMAKQKLSDDEQAQADGTTVSTSAASTSALTTDSASTIRLVAARTNTPGGGKPTSAPTGGAVADAQRAVVAAQQALDRAIKAQDGAVAALATACSATGDATPTTLGTTAGSSGTLSGSVGSSAAIVTLLDANNASAVTTSSNPQQVDANGSYSFAGLTAGAQYTVQIARTAVIDTVRCTAAVGAVGSAQHQVDTASTALDTALATLIKAVTALQSSGPTTTGTTGGRTGTGSTGTTNPSSGTSTRGSSSRTSGTGSGTTNSRTSTGTTGSASGGSASGGSGTGGATGTSTGVITAAQIAADAKTIDAATASVAVARSALGNATLTTPIAGTVAAVSIATGDTVSANSSSDTITVVGHSALSVTVDIGLADIDLVKAGEPAEVTVDGRAGAVAGRVTYVGQLNAASSTGTSSSYPVTVQLGSTGHGLYDGMGASVAIVVGSARNTLMVPLSAVHTTSTLHTVEVYANGNVTTTRVTTGLVGDDTVQISSGLRAGQRVVLAELSASIPSSTTNAFTRRSGSSLTGLTGGTGSGPPAGGGPPGGGFGGR